MKSNQPEVSSLRQYIDVLGAQMTPGAEVDPDIVRQMCININMEASDWKKPLPTDIFQPGVGDVVMRCALTGLVMVVMQSLNKMTKGTK